MDISYFLLGKQEIIKVNVFINLVILFEKIKAGKIFVRILNKCFYKKDSKYGNS